MFHNVFGRNVTVNHWALPNVVTFSSEVERLFPVERFAVPFLPLVSNIFTSVHIVIFIVTLFFLYPTDHRLPLEISKVGRNNEMSYGYQVSIIFGFS